MSAHSDFKIGLKSLYGFSKPYNFYRAIPVASAILLLTLVALVSGREAIVGSLNAGTYRFIYFLYLGLIAVVAAGLSFLPRFAWFLIALCFIEFSLGMGTQALVKIHVLKSSMLPINDHMRSEPQFQFHALLMGTPTPNLLTLSPFKIQHDSYGLRESERDKSQLMHQIVIATVGGSTTYDEGVPNGQTWSNDLERLLGNKYAVLNHGVPGYSTVENLIQTLFYLDSYNVRPKCAIYYEGWNDIRNAHLPNLDAAYANFHLLSQITNLELRKTPLWAKISPLGQIVLRYFQAPIEIIPLPKSYSHQAPQQGTDIRLEKLFRSNLKAIVAVNGQRGITSIFVGQVLNRAKLRANTRYGWLPLVRDVDVWPLQAHFNKILDETALELGIPVFIPPINQFQDADFVDNGHFSTEGSRKFAAMLAPLVRANCK